MPLVLAICDALARGLEQSFLTKREIGFQGDPRAKLKLTQTIGEAIDLKQAEEVCRFAINFAST